MNYNLSYFDEISNSLKNKNLCAFIGSGVSRTYKDKITNKVFEGIPTATDIISDLSEKLSYIDKSLSFEQVFFLIKKHEGKQGLIKRLNGYINKANIKPLPSHEILADLPFSVFITTNFDTLMEKALDLKEREYSVIVNNYDIVKWSNNQIPLIKLHGCINRSDTLIAAEDDYELIDLKVPLISALVKTLLAYKNILFLGYSLSDPDFKRLYSELKYILGEYMPKSYAVVYNVSEYDDVFWNDKGLKIIKSDLTLFLYKIRDMHYKNSRINLIENMDWKSNSFFATISNMPYATSETQAINAFLDHLKELTIYESINFNDLLNDATEAVDFAMNIKPNFVAFKAFWNKTKPLLETLSNDSIAFQNTIINIIDNRVNITKKINHRWNEVVKPNYNILVYAQSIRMMDLLKTVVPNVQKTCELYICECRIKSPNSFDEAFHIVKYLEETQYKNVYIIPDVCSCNLIDRGEINIIITGVDTVFWRDNKPISYVNPCGSLIMYQLAKIYGIPIFIISDSEKNVFLHENERDEDYYDMEFSDFPGISNISNEISLNIRYDLIKIDQKMLDSGLLTIISD